MAEGHRPGGGLLLWQHHHRHRRPKTRQEWSTLMGHPHRGQACPASNHRRQVPLRSTKWLWV